jgi:hypothetical protein
MTPLLRACRVRSPLTEPTLRSSGKGKFTWAIAIRPGEEFVLHQPVAILPLRHKDREGDISVLDRFGLATIVAHRIRNVRGRGKVLRFCAGVCVS